MPIAFSKHTWALLALMFVLHLAVLTGTVTGLIPDILRLAASVAALIAIGLDWRKSRRG